MMKVFCSVLVIVGACGVFAKFDESLLTDDAKKLKETLHNTCVEKTALSEDVFKAATEGDLKEDVNLKCYTKCVMTESAMLNDQGKFDFAPLKQWLPESETDEKIKSMEACVPKTEGINDLCEKAFALVKCIAETDPDNFYFI